MIFYIILLLLQCIVYCVGKHITNRMLNKSVRSFFFNIFKIDYVNHKQLSSKIEKFYKILYYFLLFLEYDTYMYVYLCVALQEQYTIRTSKH